MNSAVETVLSDPEVSRATTAIITTDIEQAQRGSAIERALATEQVRRALNIVIALLLLVVFAPVMLAVALIILISSPGPVIYRQPRVGIDRRGPRSTDPTGRRRVDYGGRLFTIYKFRTMRNDTSPAAQVWARRDDCRVTPVGRILRSYRLDELPQLINVLKGDMNIVGPRPEQPEIFMNLREVVSGYSQRQRVLPGITGWAQINLSYDSSLETVQQKTRFDLEYIQRCSVWQDMKILLRTVPVMVFRRGAW